MTDQAEHAGLNLNEMRPCPRCRQALILKRAEFCYFCEEYRDLAAEVGRLRTENEELKSFIINMQHAYKLDIEACEEELKRLRSQLGSLSTEVGGI